MIFPLKDVMMFVNMRPVFKLFVVDQKKECGGGGLLTRLKIILSSVALSNVYSFALNGKHRHYEISFRNILSMFETNFINLT